MFWKKEGQGDTTLYWEAVKNEGETKPHFLIRAKVPGGWLVKTGSGIAFLPDPNHEWK